VVLTAFHLMSSLAAVMSWSLLGPTAYCLSLISDKVCSVLGLVFLVLT